MRQHPNGTLTVCSGAGPRTVIISHERLDADFGPVGGHDRALALALQRTEGFPSIAEGFSRQPRFQFRDFPAIREVGQPGARDVEGRKLPAFIPDF